MLIGIFNPLGAQTDRLRCEVCQNLILRPMNTGLLRYAVATAPTVYGIETMVAWLWLAKILKVATAPTVYGIETLPSIRTCANSLLALLQQHLPFTVLKL